MDKEKTTLKDLLKQEISIKVYQLIVIGIVGIILGVILK